jgi:hypothetical protein
VPQRPKTERKNQPLDPKPATRDITTNWVTSQRQSTNSICGEEECLPSFQLREKAEGIADEGLQFFNGAIDLYRRSIK